MNRVKTRSQAKKERDAEEEGEKSEEKETADTQNTASATKKPRVAIEGRNVISNKKNTKKRTTRAMTKE